MFSFIKESFKPLRKRFWAIFVLDALAWPLDALLWPLMLRWVVDIFGRYDGDRMAAWDALKWPIGVGIFLIIAFETMARVMGFLMAKTMPTFLADLRLRMFDHVQRHSPKYFIERFSGSLANKITDMTNQVETIVNQLFFPLVPAVSATVLGAVFFWFVNPLFALVLLLWIVIHLICCLYFAKRSAPFQERHAQARSNLMGRIVDSLTNYFSVNLFFGFHRELSLVEQAQKDEVQKNRAAKQHVEKMRLITSIFYFSVGVLGLNGLMFYLWLHDEITTGMAVQIFTGMWNLGSIMWMVGSSLPLTFQSIGTLKQAYQVMLDPKDVEEEPGQSALQISKGKIAFHKVHFQYGDTKLFEDKDIEIQGGEKVGIVGYTGAGKSTFINLLLRLWHPNQGKITIDGQDISRVTLSSLRESMALIPQEPVLFHRSIKENIAYGRAGATDEEIFKAAKMAHADSFITALPNGYDSIVGERGAKLSGGEKQRIAVARAFLANAPILILDEATSSLDSVTESLLQESLKTLMQNKTTLVIAHRLSTLSQMDRILVFDQGKIVEEGSHDVLLAKGGLYATLWKTQVRFG